MHWLNISVNCLLTIYILVQININNKFNLGESKKIGDIKVVYTLKKKCR